MCFEEQNTIAIVGASLSFTVAHIDVLVIMNDAVTATLIAANFYLFNYFELTEYVLVLFHNDNTFEILNPEIRKVFISLPIQTALNQYEYLNNSCRCILNEYSFLSQKIDIFYQ